MNLTVVSLKIFPGFATTKVIVRILFMSKGSAKTKATVIQLHESISKGVFVEVLAFLYNGSPDICKDDDKNFVKEIQVVAEKFQLAWLTDICSNILKEIYS
ncbi:hypothetical protein OS493_002540 [Desmophyllum pertusum]|uniref:BTB domain-containing protein n=1 Tax=Desmophyllum pertusum TaxID=174260 RepID=A0A9X0CPQ3_9CNID|nr:hypothetical protein OS493_002540 [Desmophyllum pertusum]